MQDGGPFHIGLLDAAAEGAGLDGGTLKISVGEGALFERTFTDTASALAFFDDNLLTIPRRDLTNPPLSIRIDFTSATAGAGFKSLFIVDRVDVPEPTLLAPALLASAGLLRRRRPVRLPRTNLPAR